MMKSVLKWGLVVVITMALLEGGAWVVLHFFAKQPDPVMSETHLFDAHRNHRLNPEYNFTRTPKGKLHSADGFRRGGPVSLVPLEDTVRIMVLGTSALYGSGSGGRYPESRPLFNDETITYFLEKGLKEKLEKDGVEYGVEVVNAGVSAYRTFQELIYLNSTLLEYSPDIVINLDGHNDFYGEELNDRWEMYAYSTSILVNEFKGRTLFLSLFSFVRSMAVHSHFFNLVEKAMKRIWYAKKVNNRMDKSSPRDFSALTKGRTAWKERARRTFLRDFWQIHALGEYGGYTHMVFLQPEVVFERDDLLNAHDRQMKQITLDFMPKGLPAHMQVVRRELPGMFAEAAIPFDDVGELAPYNADGRDLYVDYCHLTPHGSALLAELMGQRIYPMILDRIRSGK